MDWPPVSNSPTLNWKKGTVYLNGSRKIYGKSPSLISWKPRALVKYVLYFGFIWPVSVKVDMSEFLGRYVMGKCSA